MELLKIEDLLNNLWREIEVNLGESSREIKSPKIDDLKRTTENVLEEVGKQFSYTFIELGDNHNGKGHHVDAVIEHIIALSQKAYAYLYNEYTDHTCNADLLEYFMTALDNLVIDTRLKFSHLQYAMLSPPAHYVRHIKTLEAIKVEYILVTVKEETLNKFIVSSLRDYFANPIPSNHSSYTPNDGFRSLEYFVGLVDSLYEICRTTEKGELEETVYHELIHRNFNRIQFIRALVNHYKKSIEDIEDPIEEIGQLFVRKREIDKIPVASDMAYMPLNTGLKEFLLRAISIEIKFRKEVIKHREKEIALCIRPIFSINRNVVQFLMLFNTFLNLSLLKRIGKGSIPQFVRGNFVRSNGDTFSLGSLQKKNSIRDRKDAHALVEMLNKVIEYLTRNYL